MELMICSICTGDLYKKLRIIPAGHSQPVADEVNTSTISTSNSGTEDGQSFDAIYEPLVSNPYLPFFHVWKPNTNWTNAKWDKGSNEGLKTIPPAFWIGVVE
jgi:tRNA-splicing endonuclease subunit Sen54